MDPLGVDKVWVVMNQVSMYRGTFFLDGVLQKLHTMSMTRPTKHTITGPRRLLWSMRAVNSVSLYGVKKHVVRGKKL